VTAPPPAPKNDLPEALQGYNLGIESASAAIMRVHLTWALVFAGVVVVIGLAALKMRDYYANDSAKWEALYQQEKVGKDTAIAMFERQQRRNDSLVAAVRVDTELVTRVIETAPKPVLVPITQPNGIVSEVPMIPAVTFDTTAARCTRLAHDCTAALAGKDSAMAKLQTALADADSMTAARTRQFTDAERASLWSKILYGLGGAVVGRASCSVR